MEKTNPYQRGNGDNPGLRGLLCQVFATAGVSCLIIGIFGPKTGVSIPIEFSIGGLFLLGAVVLVIWKKTSQK
jgi:LPXTG-motif cell wall-anchored protein